MKQEIVFVGTGCGWGAANMGTAKGPGHLFSSKDPNIDSGKGFSSLSKRQLILKNFHDFNLFESYLPLLGNYQKIRKKHLKEALDYHYQTIDKVILSGQKPFSIGGDHALAIATWSAVKKHYPEFGLIWIDAHLDAHTPLTSFSTAIHGMPVAALLGFGDEDLTNLGDIKPKIKPENIAYIGARDYEDNERELLRSLGVKIFKMHHVEEKGFAAVFSEAKEHVTKNLIPYGISLDLDAFTPNEAPGTGATAIGGIKEQDVLPILRGILHDSALVAFELMEFNPDLDEKNKTLSLIWRLVKTLLGDTNDGKSS